MEHSISKIHKINQKVLIYIVAIIILIGTGSFILLYKSGRFHKSNNSKIAMASSGSATLSSQADWQAGINVSTDLTSSPGDVKIATTESAITTGTRATTGSGDANLTWDDNTATGIILNEGEILTHDFGETLTLTKIRFYVGEATRMKAECWDGGAWQTITGGMGPFDPGVWNTALYSGNCTKVRATTGPAMPMVPPIDLRELQIYKAGAALATHTSGDTQITDANLWQWQTFTPTYTKPANTDIQFRFQTSADGVNWNGWTAYQSVGSGSSADLTALVASWSGTEENPGTFYKYIQVESKLTNTDGTSTPTLSAYTIGYHTNVKPNQPTAVTAVIGG